MPHSQGLSNNPYPEPNQSNFLILSSYQCLGFPRGLLPLGFFDLEETIKFLIVKPSLPPILIHFGSKYSPEDPVSINLQRAFLP